MLLISPNQTVRLGRDLPESVASVSNPKKPVQHPKTPAVTRVHAKSLKTIQRQALPHGV